MLLKEAADRLLLGQDMFGREASFKRVEIDDSYPEYLLKHRAEYEYLIMPPVSKAKIAWTKATMKEKRFVRRVIRKLHRILGK